MAMVPPRRPDGPGLPAGGQSDASAEPRFPRNPTDISSAVEALRRVSGGRLTDELIKPILFHAAYDCMHLTAASKAQSSRHSSGPETTPEPYLDTHVLRWLGDFEVARADGRGVQQFSGRIRRIAIEATGRDQGWASDPDAGAWSWFELGKTSADGGRRERKTWKHNAIGCQRWQRHRTVWRMDVDGELTEAERELGDWLRTLQPGDRLGIIPMASFSGWSCHVSEGKIEIEIELWR